MKTTTSEIMDELTLAEAAAWLTRLQGSERTIATDAAFKAWLSATPANARAFTRVNDVWELLPGAAMVGRPMQIECYRRSRRSRAPWFAAAACTVALLVALGLIRMLPEKAQVYQTASGAQKTVVLDDHSRATLNTDSKLTVKYSKNERRVVLERGEALFHVTENPRRPFIVQTGNAQVVDLGTVFDVRNYSSDVTVTLMEGKVWVRARATPRGQSPSSTVLTPGERLAIRPDGASVLDRPDIKAMLAWRHGQIYFNDTTLSDAVAELNRYGGIPIRIADPKLGALRVSGVFSVRAPAEFASAVASLHSLHAKHKDGVIVLAH